MATTRIARCLVAAAVGLAAAALGQEPAAGDGPGWTGATHAADVIAARQALMMEIERLMQPIDTSTAGDPVDADVLTESAGTIATMLLAVPHLFPPTTNLYDPAAETPATIALPAIWESFDAFYSMSAQASEAAAALAATEDPAQLPDAARRLRGSCDACHAVYLRPYVPRQVSQEDLEFDFDSVFKKE